jgi:predicted transposase YdaD
LAHGLLWGWGMSGLLDVLFRYGYKYLEVARAALRYNLPPELVDSVDWTTLRYESEIIIDSERETIKDVLLSARLLGSREEDPPHFFLIEHQTTVPRLMAWRLLDYVRRVVEYCLERHPESKRIAEVTPMVVYTRREQSWWAHRRLEELYGPKGGSRPWEDRRLGLGFGYHVDDLPVFTAEQVLKRPGPALWALLLLVLSFSGTPELAQLIPTWAELFAQVHAEPYGPRKLYRVLQFLKWRREEAAYDAARWVLASIVENQRTRERLMTRSMATELEVSAKRRGLAEGMAKGRVEGRDEGLAEGLAISLFKILAFKGWQVDDALRKVIESCTDPEKLELWVTRALAATRIEEVLYGPAQ